MYVLFDVLFAKKKNQVLFCEKEPKNFTQKESKNHIIYSTSHILWGSVRGVYPPHDGSHWARCAWICFLVLTMVMLCSRSARPGPWYFHRCEEGIMTSVPVSSK